MTPTPLSFPPAEATRSWIEERSRAGLGRARELADTLRTAPPASALEALKVWDELEQSMRHAGEVAGTLANVHPLEEVRTACEAVITEGHKLWNEFSQDAALYAAFDRLDASGLDAQAALMLDHVLRDFRRSGVDRDEATRARLTEINARLTELNLEFSRVIRDDVRSIKVTREQLAGLPEDWFESHPADADGLITVTSDYPDYVPARMFVHDAAVRAELSHVYNNRAYPHNDAVLREMFELRHEYATLVGYDDWPSYDADVKMIGSGPAIPEFIDKIAAVAAEPSARDLAVLLERYRQDFPDAAAVPAADSAYYSELVCKERFDVDSQVVRTYFDFTKVRQGLLDVTGRLFGVRYEKADVPTWHEDVAAYDVIRLADGVTLGRIYLDLHPREGKYKHAAKMGLAAGLAGRQLAEATLVCNFSKQLMEHDHVVTLFHEFGHLVHHVLAGQAEWVGFSGISTERDFVEAPSQMLEEWAWDVDILQSFATNAAGEPIPAELVEKMRAGDEFGKGYHLRRQLFLAAVSYWFHQSRPADLTSTMIDLFEKYSPWPYEEDTHFYAAFGHLGGYTSGYYTYQWSLVIAKDLFSAFDPADMFNAEIAGRYRDKVLAPGGSKPAAELVADFLGRPFSFDAYAAWLAS